MSAISAVNVTKNYKDILALKNFSLEMEEGSIFALLGPNGAGKTTFLKCVLGLTDASSGEIKINGINVSDCKARQLMSYLPEKFTYYSFETPTGLLQFFAKMRGMKGGDIQKSIDSSLGQLGISELANRKMGEMSKGQMQRVGLASTLIGHSKILLLDEPFSGLDPIAMKEVKDLFVQLKNEGRTVFINSHILSEMEKICDSFAILNKGECLAQGKLKQLVPNGDLEDYFYHMIKGNK